MDKTDLIRRAKAAMYRYQEDPFDVEQATIETLNGRLYVRLAGQGRVLVYRVHQVKNGETIRVMKRPPAGILRSKE